MLWASGSIYSKALSVVVVCNYWWHLPYDVFISRVPTHGWCQVELQWRRTTWWWKGIAIQRVMPSELVWLSSFSPLLHLSIQDSWVHACTPSMSDVPPLSSSTGSHILELCGRIPESYLMTQLRVHVGNMETAARPSQHSNYKKLSKGIKPGHCSYFLVPEALGQTRVMSTALRILGTGSFPCSWSLFIPFQPHQGQHVISYQHSNMECSREVSPVPLPSPPAFWPYVLHP